MSLDRLARLVVRGRVHAPLPHLDGLVFEPGLFVENGEVLQRGEVARIQVDRAFELGDSIVELPALSVDEREVVTQPVGERVDRDALLEQPDRESTSPFLYAAMPSSR